MLIEWIIILGRRLLTWCSRNLNKLEFLKTSVTTIYLHTQCVYQVWNEYDYYHLVQEKKKGKQREKIKLDLNVNT